MSNIHINTKFRRARGYGYMLRAIAKAGGAVHCFTPERLKQMTAMELVETLGNNNIFCKHIKFENKPNRTRKVNKTMPIIINTEKVWRDGQQYRKVLNFKALTFEQLPEEYHKNGVGPCCFINIDNDLIIWDKALTGTWYSLEKNKIINEQDFQTVLKLIKKAGNRLMKINKRRAEEKRKQWSGKEKLTI